MRETKQIQEVRGLNIYELQGNPGKSGSQECHIAHESFTNVIGYR